MIVSEKRFGDFWDDLTAGVTNAIPAHTVVGKALRGETEAAVTAGLQYATTPAKPTVAPKSYFGANVFGKGGIMGLSTPVVIGVGALGLLLWFKFGGGRGVSRRRRR